MAVDPDRSTILDSILHWFRVLITFMEVQILSLSQRLTQIVEPLRAAIASHAGRNRADAPLAMLLWTYLRRLAARFAVLAARPAGYVARTRSPSKARSNRIPAQRLPQGFGWLVRLAQETAVYGTQLQHLLSQPEMAAFLAASPRSGSILRPLVRMLAIDPAPDMPAVLFRRRHPRNAPLTVPTTHVTTGLAALDPPSFLSPKPA